jgi:predicted O-linked N-acetylglucosamine transferase (SPINDLY family)
MASSADEVFRRGVSAMQTGQFDIAERLFRHAISLQPEHLPALDMFSIFLARRGRADEAARYARRALAAYDEVLQLKPNLAEPWLGRGNVLIRLGRNAEAIDSFDRAIAAKPDFAQAHLSRAKLLTDLRRWDDALAGIDKLLSMAPNLAEAWLGRGNILFELRRYDESLGACEQALMARPDLAEAWLARGNALNELKRYENALAAYDEALTLNSRLAGAWIGSGNVLSALKRHDAALASYDKALARSPKLAEAWLGRGNVLNELKRPEEAFAAFDRALTLIPYLVEAQLGRGNVWFGVKRYDEALAAYDQALALNSGLTEALLGRGNVLDKLKRHEEAVDAYAQVLKIDPQHPFTKGLLLHQMMLSCDWRKTENLTTEIDNDIAAGRLSAEPFGWQAVAKSPRSLQLCAELYNRERYPANIEISSSRPSAGHAKIRIGYSSGELREQATSHLIVGVFEHHDHSRFEIYGIDNGWDDESAIRKRINTALHGIIDIRQLSDASAAAAIREKQIDILVNLNGYFGEHRTQMFGRRPAPLQVNYLGFPGTLGATYIDYIIADRHVIPEDHKAFYTEKVVYLPNCYQANDRERQIGTRVFNRQECGLPVSGFVFCCFNNNYKIAPEIFDCWMRILCQVDGSVLWLFEDNEDAAINLRKEAAARNLSPERLVFAKRVAPADHLARHRLADLFLDTLPYTAHTTASDSLWAGLPLLTCRGGTFPGRVAASLLDAVGLPELVTTTLDAYERAAVDLATQPEKLTLIKRKLADGRLTTPLFDTRLFTKHIETAYIAIYERHRAGLVPDHIDISS